jgi:hypothetical protein
MDESTRIKKDLIMYEENIKNIENINLDDAQKKTVKLASQYYEDSKYYFSKKDFFTAFGCINYAHGLLDSIIKF